MKYYVYILTNQNRTVLYTGVTNSIERRTYEHKEGTGSSFTSKYKCRHLLYYEEHNDIRFAIAREKQLKNWKRDWKVQLIKTMNPDLRDLAAEWWLG